MKWLLSSACASAGLLASAMAGCSSEPEYEYYYEDGGGSANGDAASDAGSGSDTSNSTPDLQFLPAAVYSGFDGTHPFKAPIAVYGGGDDVVVTAADPSVCDIEPTALLDPGSDRGKWFMLTMKKAGATQLTTTSGGKSATVLLTVTEYAPGRYAVGESRYTNAAGAEPACLQCHGGQAGIDHSPAALASAQDAQIEAVITTGIKVAGNPIQSTPEHTWTPTSAQLDGLVTYLRALPPRNF